MEISATVLFRDATALTHAFGNGVGKVTVSCCPAFSPPLKATVVPHCMIKPLERRTYPFGVLDPAAPPPTGAQLPDWQLSASRLYSCCYDKDRHSIPPWYSTIKISLSIYISDRAWSYDRRGTPNVSRKDTAGLYSYGIETSCNHINICQRYFSRRNKWIFYWSWITNCGPCISTGLAINLVIKDCCIYKSIHGGSIAYSNHLCIVLSRNIRLCWTTNIKSCRSRKYCVA